MENYYNTNEDRLVFPKDLVSKSTYEADYESIYEGCSEDISRAFNRSCEKLICISSLTQSEKDAVISKFLKGTKYSAGIMPGYGIRPFSIEFKKVLKEIAKTGCFKINRKGTQYGVTLPRDRYYFGIVGVMAMPWHLMVIDYEAQRWTDIPHVIKLLMKHESDFAMGTTARITTDGTEVHVNEGRHGAFEIGLTGAPHCWGRAIISDNRGRSFDIFDLLNILPKPTEVYDEYRIKKGRAEEYSKHNLTVKVDPDAKIDDQLALDIHQMNEATEVRYVSKEARKSGMKSLEKGDMFRVDKGIDLVKKYGLSTVSDANRITREAFEESYLPHEVVWAICELLKNSNVPAKKMPQVRDAIVLALQERYPSGEFPGHKQGLAFYDDFKQARKNTEDDQPFAGYISANNFVEKFLGTALYSIVIDEFNVKANVKQLLKAPKVEWKPGQIVDKDGNLFNFDLIATSKQASEIEGFEDEYDIAV